MLPPPHPPIPSSPYPPSSSTPMFLYPPIPSFPPPGLWAQTPAVKIEIYGYPCRVWLGSGCILARGDMGETVAQASLLLAVPDAP